MMLDFDGSTYRRDRDGIRLNGLLLAVREVMSDGRWRTLADVQTDVQTEVQTEYGLHGTEASISARLRDLRKERFGGHEIERMHVDRGLWVYRMVRAATEGGAR